MSASNPQPNEATIWLHNAIQLEGSRQYQEAEECYTRAILILRASILDPALSPEEKNKLMNYMSDVAKRVQRLREYNRGAAGPSSTTASGGSSAPQAAAPELPSSTPQPAPAPAPAPARAPAKAVVPKKTPKKVTPPPPPPSAPQGKPVPTPLPAPSKDFLATPVLDDIAGSGKDGNKATPPPPAAPARSAGLANHFAPRTSDFVLRAIDIATALAKRGEIKRAVDVLQHAYAVGVRQRNNPSNFGSIGDALQLMRQRYYTQFPPRFLQDNPVLASEMELLRKSGITNTILLPIWDDLTEGYGAENVFMPSEGIWEDDFTPELGPSQKKNGARMMHISDIFPNHSNNADGEDSSLTIIRNADPLNIVQTVVGDCSMVCSLIICASFQKRFPKAKIISNVIFPQDNDGNPLINAKGKYCVKMLINGMTRLVTVDDRLPANPRLRDPLLCTYSRDRSELWVSLMEKAFVKVCGGSYNFPGSTSSSDLYKLSGWLPDSFQFKGKDFDKELQWRRLVHNFKIGAVLLTVTTPNDFSPALEKQLDLSGGHAYAVLDIQEVDGMRVVLLRNPWSRFTWSGTYSIKDTSEAATKVHEAMGLTKEHSELGLFVLSWDDLITHFDTCCLSWNPYLLYRTPEGMFTRPTRLACHGTFDYAPYAMGSMPQLHIGVANAPAYTRMHLVVSRHVTDVTEFGQQFDKNSGKIPFIALKVYDVTGAPSVAEHLGGRCQLGMCYCRRLASSTDLSTYLQPLNDVVYRNSAAHTVSFDCPVGSSQLVVVVSRTESAHRNSFHFSVTLHTNLPQIRLGNTPNTTPGPEGNQSGVYMHMIPSTSLKNTSTIQGVWKKGKTCGGRSDASTFIYNPQYTLTLQRPAYISARVSITDDTCTESSQLLLARRKNWAPNETPMTTFASRVGNVNTEVELVMKAKLYGNGGSMIDSALPHTLCYDMRKLLGNRPIEIAKKLRVKVVGAISTSGVDSFTMYDLDDSDEVTTVLLASLNQGFMVTPSQSKIMARGSLAPFTSSLQPIMQDGNSNADTFEVEMHSTLQMQPLAKGTAEASQWDEVCRIAKHMSRCSSQMSSYPPQLATLARQSSSAVPPLSSEVKKCVTEWCAFMTDYAKRRAAAPAVRRIPPEMLPPLPAGEYTLIPSLWSKGVPGTFEMVVETTEPHTVLPIREEGDGMMEKLISAQLLPKGGAIRGSCEPPMKIRKDDAAFHNSKVRVQVSSRSTFTCRLLLLEDAVDAEKKSNATAVYTNVSLFSVRDTDTMEMVASSGSYTSFGAAIAPVVLEAQKQYILVVSASKPSSSKYALRIYTKNPCTAELTA